MGESSEITNNFTMCTHQHCSTQCFLFTNMDKIDPNLPYHPLEILTKFVSFSSVPQRVTAALLEEKLSDSPLFKKDDGSRGKAKASGAGVGCLPFQKGLPTVGSRQCITMAGSR